MKHLRTQEQIVSSWQGDIARPLVSIACITYNHEAYIVQAIDGFLQQNTTFPFEIWIHDDASTDSTVDIIKGYQEKYPQIIKLICQEKNQYSQGRRPSTFLFPNCIGEYIAICEGDDYWIDADKLSKQLVLFEQYPDCEMCFHLAKQITPNGDEVVIGQYRQQSGVVNIEDILMKSYGQIATASTVIKRRVLDDLQPFLLGNSLTVGDVYLHFFSSMKGGAIFCNEVMSVYRVMVEGSWSASFFSGGDVKFKHFENRINSYQQLNEFTEFRFSRAFYLANRKVIKTAMLDRDVNRARKAKFLKLYSHYLANKDYIHAWLIMQRISARLFLGRIIKKLLLR